MEKIERIFIISPKESISSAIQKLNGVIIDGQVKSQNEALGYLLTANLMPNSILITENTEGRLSTHELILEIKKKYPSIRIIYLAGEVDLNDKDKVNALSILVDYGIYDIYWHSRINQQILTDIIFKHKTVSDVQELYQFRSDKKGVYEETMEHIIDAGRDNVIMVSSIKPGTGKTFISTNIATAIAAFGQNKNGRPPKVAILEGDLQTLSVGTILGVQHDKYNLREALMMISTIVDDDGNISDDDRQIERVNQFIEKCLLPYPAVPNLYALVGSQLNFSDLSTVNAYQYFYLLETVAELFDIVIIDANSSLEHTTTGPMLQLAKLCYYVIDLDFNGIRSNLRYKQELKKLNVLDKVEYVLNKAVTKELESKFLEKLDYNEAELRADGFKITARVPMVDTVITFNRMFTHNPVILDKTFDTLQARIEITKLANNLWPMGNTLDLQLEVESYSDNVGKSKGKNKSKKNKHS